MLLYNGGPVDWFYDGLKTEDEMRADERYSKLFDAPCVLYDNGYSKAYEFDTLEHVCSKMAVPYSDSAAQYSFQCVMAFLDGTYNAPGVDQVYDIAYDARNTADEAKATAGTAAASVDEYMDALLGLSATDETEATDAE